MAALAGVGLISFAGGALILDSALGSDVETTPLPELHDPAGPTVVRPQVTTPVAPTATLPVPAQLVDNFLDMRADPVAVPIDLHMPTIGTDATILGVGVTDENVMDAPLGNADDPVWRTAFWYRGSAIPGETSTALIAGHATAPKGRPAVFGRIQELRQGDPIVIHDTRSGLDVRYEVTELQIYSLTQSQDPAVVARIYGAGPATGAWPTPSDDGLAHLTLITCAGTFRSADGTHDHRLVVYATRVA